MEIRLANLTDKEALIALALEKPRSKSKCNNFQKEIVHAKNLPTSTA